MIFKIVFLIIVAILVLSLTKENNWRHYDFFLKWIETNLRHCEFCVPEETYTLPHPHLRINVQALYQLSYQGLMLARL